MYGADLYTVFINIITRSLGLSLAFVGLLWITIINTNFLVITVYLIINNWKLLTKRVNLFLNMF